jgi:hypothetical protein
MEALAAQCRTSHGGSRISSHAGELSAQRNGSSLPDQFADYSGEDHSRLAYNIDVYGVFKAADAQGRGWR